MSRFSFESSALAKRCLEEPGTARVLEVIRSEHRVMASRLSMVEVASAAVRHAREGLIPEEVLEAILLALEGDFRSVFEVKPLEAAILGRAVDIVRAHALRAADAIQLATALHCAGKLALRADLVLVSADQELNDAASEEGLTVLDPCRA
ncbi:MAG: type II toxin-antitoxin system VapC family toxin [Phycisphaerales bacterium]|nr:type II toxin-antitoxin system VapC family toxin [Phycisphaerales bacterium]